MRLTAHVGSFQEDFYLETSSPVRRLWRNVRLMIYVLRVAWMWGVAGFRVRREIARARRCGDPFVIDELGARPESSR